MKDEEGLREVAHIAASKLGDKGKMAKGEVFKFEADNVAEGGHRQNDLGYMTKQVRQRTASAATGAKEIAAVNV